MFFGVPTVYCEPPYLDPWFVLTGNSAIDSGSCGAIARGTKNRFYSFWIIAATGLRICASS
jgi:hypothetical protein